MQCRNHPEEKGVNTCNQCGSWLCDKCSFERGGRIFCPSCAAQQATGGGTHHSAEYSHITPEHVSKSTSWGVLFLFSVVIPLPGLNYMYLGLIKRGLVAMSAFFATIYLATQFGGGGLWPLGMVFVFAIPVLWLSCTFDGFRIRARINAGETVTDNVDEIVAFVRRNGKVLVVLLLLLLLANTLGAVLPGILRVLWRVVPILIAVWAVLAIVKKPR